MIEKFYTDFVDIYAPVVSIDSGGAVNTTGQTLKISNEPCYIEPITERDNIKNEAISRDVILRLYVSGSAPIEPGDFIYYDGKKYIAENVFDLTKPIGRLKNGHKEALLKAAV
jgi:hypothetical protein